MQIFVAKCHYFGFDSRSVHPALKLKKVKKPQKVSAICTPG